MIGIVVLLVHHLRQSKVGDLDLSANVAFGQQNVARLQVVVNDRRLDFVEVLESRDDLHDDGARLALRYRLVLLQIEVEVMAVAVLEDRTKRVGIDLEDVVEFHDTRMVERLVDVVFPQGVSVRKER